MVTQEPSGRLYKRLHLYRMFCSAIKMRTGCSPINMNKNGLKGNKEFTFMFSKWFESPDIYIVHIATHSYLSIVYRSLAHILPINAGSIHFNFKLKNLKQKQTKKKSTLFAGSFIDTTYTMFSIHYSVSGGGLQSRFDVATIAIQFTLHRLIVNQNEMI